MFGENVSPQIVDLINPISVMPFILFGRESLASVFKEVIKMVEWCAKS